MKDFNKHGLLLTWTARFLAGSRITWLALPSSHSYSYGLKSSTAPGKAIAHPKFRTLVQHAA